MRFMKGKLKRHIFVPYALAILSFAAILCAYLSFQSAHSIEKENRAMLGNMLSGVAEQMDTMFTELDAVSYDILQNRSLYPYTAFSSGYYSMLASNELMSYRASNVYLSDVILYYDEQTASKYSDSMRFLTSAGAYDANTFWKLIHPLEGWTHALFREKVSTLRAPEILFPVHESHRAAPQDYLLYLTSASSTHASVNNRGCVIFMIARKHLDSLFSQSTAQHDGAVCVLHADGRPLYWTENAQEKQFILPEPFDTTTLQPQVSSTENGGLCVALRTAARGYIYLLHLPKSPYPSPYMTALFSLLPLLVLLLLAGGAAASALASSIYRPISQVSQLVLPQHESAQSDTLWGIVNSVREMRDRNNELEKQIAYQKELSIVHNLRMLLYCNYTSGDALLEQLYGLGLRLYAPWHFVMTGRIHAQDDVPEKRNRCMGLIAVMHKPYYVIPLDAPSDFAMLCGLENGQDVRQILMLFHYQLNHVFRDTEGCVSLGCSKPFAEILTAHEALRDSQEALSGIFLHGKGKLLELSSTQDENPEDTSWYPFQEEESLQNALKQGDETSACLIARGIIELIVRKCHSAHTARTICQNLVQYLLTAMHLPGLEKPLYPVAELLTRPDAVLASFEKALLNACASVCQLSSQQQAGEGKEVLLSGRLEEYLQAHFFDSTLSMAKIAAHFELSEGYLSRTFKAQTGTSIILRLGAIRLQHAQKLMRETELALDDVIAQCGYVDKSHFIRTFKKACFITPIQYRKLSKQPALGRISKP